MRRSPSPLIMALRRESPDKATATAGAPANGTVEDSRPPPDVHRRTAPDESITVKAPSGDQTVVAEPTIGTSILGLRSNDPRTESRVFGPWTEVSTATSSRSGLAANPTTGCVPTVSTEPVVRLTRCNPRSSPTQTVPSTEEAVTRRLRTGAGRGYSEMTNPPSAGTTRIQPEVTRTTCR